MLLSFTVFFSILIAASKQHDLPAPEVKTSHGLVRGKISVAEDGTPFNSFFNIPYAKPPIGELRFKAPQPTEAWDGVFEAFNDPIECAQEDNLIRDIQSGQEDCLILHVHTPADATSQSPLPVMVWIHAGGFYTGTSGPALYGPEYLLKRGVVFVSINYRLGALGFLNLNTSEVPGNAGLKDQVMALKWVNKNIQNFGGDPNRVTIFGESAGSASVHYLLASPLTKGLFHRAVAQSGVSLNPWTIQWKPEESVQRLLKALNIQANNPDEILSGLSKFSGAEIAKALTNSYGQHPIDLPWGPTVETEFPGVDAFITRPPIEIFVSGDFHKCPTIIGFNNGEGVFPIFRWLKDRFKTNPTINDLVMDFERMVPDDIAKKIKETGGDMEKYIEMSRNLYFNNDKDLFAQFVDMVGDMDVIDGIHVMASVMSKHEPIHFYNFIYSGGRNSFRLLTTYNYEGACHFDENGYLFHNALFDDSKTNARDLKMMNYLHKIWTDFAKGEIAADWTPAVNGKMNCLVIDEEPKMVDAPFSKTIYFWENVRKSLNMYT